MAGDQEGGEERRRVTAQSPYRKLDTVFIILHFLRTEATWLPQAGKQNLFSVSPKKMSARDRHTLHTDIRHIKETYPSYKVFSNLWFSEVSNLK